MTPRPLEDAWRDVLDGVLRARGAPGLGDVAALAPRLVALSRAYNDDAGGPRPRVPLEARVAFSFARDVPKGGAAVRELVASGALAVPADRPLRIVDLGAGLGAMTWGIARALRDAPGAPGWRAGALEALLVDDDPDALAVAEAIARAAPLSLRIGTRRASIREGIELPTADVVVLGQVLSELDRELAPDARVERHAALLTGLLAGVEPQGSLVVVEPALRTRARHLHAVRDRLLASGSAAVQVFAPCLHARPCPARASEGDWCHEDLDVDLPEWLVPLARAAGLRWQGLTFAYLVLRRDRRSLADELRPPAPERLRLRVVSDRLVSKGKSEVFACTEHGDRPRLRRLDRDLRVGEAMLARGDVVTLDGPARPTDDRGRIGRDVGVDVWRGNH
jgi:ribosomal protein RSM22 (predicted rRNA methylase)